MIPVRAAKQGRCVGRGGQRFVRGFQVAVGVVAALRCLTASSSAFSSGIKNQPALGSRFASPLASARPSPVKQACLQTALEGNPTSWVAGLASTAAVMVFAAACRNNVAVKPRSCTQALRRGWHVSTTALGRSGVGGCKVSAEPKGDAAETVVESFSLSTPAYTPLPVLSQSAPAACSSSFVPTSPAPLLAPSVKPSRSVILKAARFVGGARHIHGKNRSPKDRSTRCCASRRNVGARLQPSPNAETAVIAFDASRLPQKIQLGLREAFRVGDRQGRESRSLTDRMRSGRCAGVLGKFKDHN